MAQRWPLIALLTLWSIFSAFEKSIRRNTFQNFESSRVFIKCVLCPNNWMDISNFFWANIIRMKYLLNAFPENLIVEYREFWNFIRSEFRYSFSLTQLLLQMIGWIPVFYSQGSQLPKDMPKWLQKAIQESEKVKCPNTRRKYSSFCELWTTR